MARKYVDTPSLVGGTQRRVSSPPGLSTLITSAPRSASSMVQYGPASTREKSATSSPDKGPAAGWVMVGEKPFVYCCCPYSGQQSADSARMVRGRPACQEAGIATGIVTAGAAWQAAQSALMAPAACSNSG